MRKNDATNGGVFGVRERMTRRRAMRMGMGAAALALGAMASRLVRAQGYGAATAALGGDPDPEDNGLLAKPRPLTVADHRRIVEIAITRRPEINPTHSPSLAAEVALARAIAIARNAPEYELAQSSLKGVETHNNNIKIASIPSHPVNVAGIKVIKKVVEHTGSTQALADLLRSESRSAIDPGLKAGLVTSADIIADGLATIYNPVWWVPQVIGPGQRGWGWGRYTGDKLNNFVHAVAVEDAKGAVAGAIAGAIAGAPGGPKGAAVGGALGALGGAVGNSVAAVIF